MAYQPGKDCYQVMGVILLLFSGHNWLFLNGGFFIRKKSVFPECTKRKSQWIFLNKNMVWQHFAKKKNKLSQKLWVKQSDLLY